MTERVVVTGIGCVSSFGLGHEALIDALVAGACGVAPITGFDTSACRSHRAATVTGFDPTAFIAPLKLRRIDTVGRFALAALHLASRDAWGDSPFDPKDTGTALGTFTAGLDSTVEYLQGLTDRGPTGVPALLFSNTVSNAPASLCAIELGLEGPNVTFNQREASSLVALAYSVRAIQHGRIGAMISGGADGLEEIFFKAHDRFTALSPAWARHEAGACDEEVARPFDGRHNGFVLGEGAYLMLLESAAGAARRGARVYGEILGVSTVASVSAMNAWPSEPSGLVRSMRAALGEAGVAPDEVDVVFATSNGSPPLDRLEAAAIHEVFGDRPVAVTSLKGSIGESSAAAAAGVVAALLAAGRGVVPPTVGFERPDAGVPSSVSGARQATPGRICVVNSVASGGTVGSLVVRTGAARA